jgi:chromosome segregation ATPase
MSNKDVRRDRSQTDFTSRIARENDELTARLYQLTPLLAGLATELATLRREYARLKRDHETLRARLNAPPRPNQTAAGE